MSAATRIERWPGLPGRLVLLAAATAVFAWIAIDLTRVAGSVSSVWIANGIVVGVLLFKTTRQWPWWIAAGWIGEFTARLLHGDALGMSIGNSLANVLEIVCVAGAIRRRVPDITDPSRLLRLAFTATASTLIACALSALIAVFNSAVGGHVSLGEVFLTWYTAHVIGMVIVATLMVVARREGRWIVGRRGRHLDYALCMGALLAVCAIVFTQERLPLLFLVFVPLMLVVFRHGFAGVVGATVVIAVLSGVATALETGPFALVESPSLLQRTLLLQLFITATCLLALPVATVLSERRRLAVRYRTLADHSRDLVVRMSADGAPSYVSPAIRHVLGYEPEEFLRARWDLVNPEDIPQASAAFQRIAETGISEPVTFRILHKDGQERWVEVAATRVESGDPDAPWELVASARDISKRMQALAALDESQSRLRAVADNMPALIVHIDADERYTFINAYYERLFGRKPDELLGRTIREARGEEAYREWAPFIHRALDGEEQKFERDPSASSAGRYLQSHFVPDVAPDGSNRGFYALTFDITPLKQAEQALAKLARVDALTGLGNRRQFDERLEQAIARSRRQSSPLVLMSLDLDKFKAINDTHGHLAGDAVLQAFAGRLTACVRDVDVVARLGGDEFVVLIEDARTAQVAELIAQKILTVVRPPVVFEGVHLQMGTSIGIAFVAQAASANALIALADKALYEAKSAGRNTWRVIED
ncbi:diguanylate cyclase domain-containing protein [Noviluteimonas gilva]|uniref:diguanylate cyclase domain-containing protein n=1 Tax=Noviluteimonas gilva TaxID=2682097 RepID=UPI0012E8775A